MSFVVIENLEVQYMDQGTVTALHFVSSHLRLDPFSVCYLVKRLFIFGGGRIYGLRRGVAAYLMERWVTVFVSWLLTLVGLGAGGTGNNWPRFVPFLGSIDKSTALTFFTIWLWFSHTLHVMEIGRASCRERV